MRNNGSRYRDDEIISKEPTLIGSFFCGCLVTWSCNSWGLGDKVGGRAKSGVRESTSGWQFADNSFSCLFCKLQRKAEHLVLVKSWHLPIVCNHSSKDANYHSRNPLESCRQHRESHCLASTTSRCSSYRFLRLFSVISYCSTCTFCVRCAVQPSYSTLATKVRWLV